MRIARRCVECAWMATALLCGGAFHIDLAAADETETATAQADEKLKDIIRQIEAEEARYQRLETRIHYRSQFGRDETSNQSFPAVERNRHTIVDGELFWFEIEHLTPAGQADERADASLATFDGQTTRVIEYRNCVNVVPGRSQPSEIVPPHNWAMTHSRADPLSVLLKGAEAIKSRPHHRVQWQGKNELARLEISVEGDETIDGLECVKIRCRSWYGAKADPTVLIMWLAKDKNHLCARSQALTSQQGPVQEARVTQWLELQPGLWLPKRISIKQFTPPYEELFDVEKATLDTGDLARRIREVELPDNLPVYRLDADGYLEQSALKTKSEPRPQAELDQLIAAVRREEERYARYDVTVKASYRKVSGGGASEVMQQNILERSVSYDGKLYSEEHKSGWSADGGTSQGDEVRVYDGEWNRQRSQSMRDGPEPESIGAAPGKPRAGSRLKHDRQEWASLGRGGPDAIVLFRPHTVIFSDDRERMHRLSSLLTTVEYDEANHYRHKVEYLGPEKREGLECEKLQVSYDFGSDTKIGYFLWLAKDRNYLPVREESYDLTREPRLPQAICQVDDLRELSPGVWFPHHSVKRRFYFKDDRLSINWAHENHVTSVDLAPKVPDSLFEVTVPAGISINVFAGKNRSLGMVRQALDGPAAISEAKWQAMLLADRPEFAEQEKRNKELAALVGKPAPAMPELEWVQGGPVSPEQLHGKVALLVFWAEWHYPENVFRVLAEQGRNLADAGVVVIVVHPRGSEPEEVLRPVEEFWVDCAIAIDAKGLKDPSWGAWYDRFGLKHPTHAFLIDRDGTIAAEGDIRAVSKAAIQKAQQ